MNIVIDTSALVAVIAGEPERERIINLTRGNDLIGPGSIPWEVGNAFSAMFKRDRMSLEEAKKGLDIYKKIPIRYIESNFYQVVAISKQSNIYAYDAYFIDCSIRQKAPLLTLDGKLKTIAQSFGIETMEI